MSKMTALAICVLGFYAGFAFIFIALIWLDWEAAALGAGGATTVWLSIMGYREITDS